MSSKNVKAKQQLLPWTNGELEALLRELISHGSEVSKVDFKLDLETKTAEQKAELLKDITAIANTYDDHNYNDYGFLVYGVQSKTIVGVTNTETDADKLQNTIEQILKSYISPMPQVYVTSFATTDGKNWGAVIIPPRNTKPHMFFKDLSCASNQTKTRKRGEWFIRRGSTTDPGFPEDLALIMQRQFELKLDPLRESIKSLQIRLGKTEEQYNSALFKLVERALKSLPEVKDADADITSDLGEALGMDLPSRLKQKLRTPKNAIADDLIAEVKSIKDYIEGANTNLTWTPQLNNPEANKKIIEELEYKVRSLQIAIATIVLKDDKEIYTDALLKSIKLLAREIEIPSGTQYNRIGEALRYYPLCIILYTIFVCGVCSNRGALLRKVLDIPIKHRDRNIVVPITDVYFYTYEVKKLINDAFSQRWCEPVAVRMRQLITDNIGDMLTDSSELEYFFKGEFVLALTNIEKCMSRGEQAEHRVPLGGLYLYLHEANDPIVDLLQELPDWLTKFYKYPLNEILDMFDRNSHKMSEAGCFATGMHGIKTVDIYQASLKKKAA
ncbi:MAG: ATP-binding protein [Candidatus Nomurabacteria bacterium]|nr:MAG: ATP-binding protein [Candidatus Nomurabacteria bacterium]